MACAIVYTTTYGSTKQYAEWIAEETGADVFAVKEAAKINWNRYDTVILGTPVFAAKPSIAAWLNKNWPKLKNKRTVMFMVTMYYAGEPEIRKVFTDSFAEHMQHKIRLFAMRGRFSLQKLTPQHRMMVNFMVRISHDEELRKQVEAGVDGVRRENIDELVKYIRAIAANRE